MRVLFWFLMLAAAAVVVALAVKLNAGYALLVAPPLPLGGYTQAYLESRGLYERVLAQAVWVDSSRAVVSAVRAGAGSAEMADMLFAAITDHRYIQIGHPADLPGLLCSQPMLLSAQHAQTR